MASVIDNPPVTLRCKVIVLGMLYILVYKPLNVNRCITHYANHILSSYMLQVMHV